NPINTAITGPPLYIIPNKFPGLGSPAGSPFWKLLGLPNKKCQIAKPTKRHTITVIAAATFDNPELLGFFSTVCVILIKFKFNVYSIFNINFCFFKRSKFTFLVEIKKYFFASHFFKF